MSKNPLISVIVTTYNNEKYIKACLDSLVAQTFQDFEIVVIDDGSTDQTSKVLNQYSANSRLKIHHQPNAGVSAARNQGLKLSRGKFVCFVDSDDYVAKNYLEKLVAPLLQDSTIDISVCGYQEIYQDRQASYPLKPQLLTGFQATKNLLLNQRDFDVLLGINFIKNLCSPITIFYIQLAKFTKTILLPINSIPLQRMCSILRIYFIFINEKILVSLKIFLLLRKL